MLVFHPQSSPRIRQFSFLFTKRSTTLLFCNPSDELWMLPGLIFTNSVMKKDHIFSLCPCFTEVQQQKCGLNTSKYSCYIKPNSLHPLHYFPPPLSSSRTAFPSPWDTESSCLYQREGLRTPTERLCVLESRQRARMPLQGLWKEAALLKLFNRLKRDMAASHISLQAHPRSELHPST